LSDPLLSVRVTAARAVGEVERKVRIDCDTCAVRDLQCGDCVMSVLLGVRGVYDVDPGEAQALDVLADQGLVPRLRLVPLGIPEIPGSRAG
jgi:hypothetical protein